MDEWGLPSERLVHALSELTVGLLSWLAYRYGAAPWLGLPDLNLWQYIVVGIALYGLVGPRIRRC